MNNEGALFMQYHYAEVKDLAKTFLTLVSAVLVLSLTFSDKIVDFLNASRTQKAYLVITWVLFITSIIFFGVALCYLAVEGGMALYDDHFTLRITDNEAGSYYLLIPRRWPIWHYLEQVYLSLLASLP